MAIVMVLLFHLVQLYGEKTNLTQGIEFLRFFSIGQKGVDLFFVLSGFLITGILLRTKGEAKYFFNFYARRSLRIFPLYFGVLLLCLIAGIAWKLPQYGFGKIWPYFLYLHNILPAFNIMQLGGPGHFWSLAVEEHFYLFWPFFVYILSRRQLFCLALLLFFIPLPLRYLMDQNGFGSFGFTLCRMDTLALGAALSIVYSGASDGWNTTKQIAWRITLPVFGLSFLSFFSLSGSHGAFLQVWKFALFAILCGIVMVLALSDQALNPLPTIFSQQWLRFLGKISYGLYVFHPFVFHPLIGSIYRPSLGPVTFRTVPILLLEVFCVFATTLGVALVSWKYFEEPILKLKSKFGGVRSEFSKAT